MNQLIRQYSVISSALILMLGIEFFVPWPWSIFGGLVMIFMIPVLFKYGGINNLISKQGFKLKCLSCGAISNNRSCPKCGASVFRPT